MAEDTGLIHALGAVMLDLACGQLQAWRARSWGLDHVSMAVNMSALQAHTPRWETMCAVPWPVTAGPPKDLVLELTETALLRAAPSTITILRALHAEGLGIAIDDFGTGYASLRYLATLAGDGDQDRQVLHRRVAARRDQHQDRQGGRRSRG